MITSSQPIAELTAADLMSGDLLLLTEEMSLREAARRFVRRRISGAPVVNAERRLIGVLSASDFVRLANKVTGGVKAAEAPLSCQFQRELKDGDRAFTVCTLPMGACSAQKPWTDSAGQQHMICAEPHCVFVDWQDVEVDSLPAEVVGRFMTRDLVTAEASTPVSELARMMVKAHVHRVIIVNSDHEPVGIVTTMDMLGAIARIE